MIQPRRGMLLDRSRHRSDGNDLSRRELERQIQELRRDKVAVLVGGMGGVWMFVGEVGMKQWGKSMKSSLGKIWVNMILNQSKSYESYEMRWWVLYCAMWQQHKDDSDLFKFICLLRVHTYAIFSSKAFLLSTRWPQPHVPYVHQVRLDDSIRKMEATQKRIFGLGPKQHALFYEGQVG